VREVTYPGGWAGQPESCPCFWMGDLTYSSVMAYTTAHADGLSGVTDSITRVVADPCLSQAVTIALRVADIRRQRQAPTPPGIPSKTPSPPRPAPAPVEPGIGLCRIVGYANKALYVYERPWVIPATLAAVVGGLVLVGYTVGRRMS